MTPAFASPRLQRSLAAVYRFYDAFLYPIDDDTPAIAAPVDVSIRSLRWSALRSDNDLTYRFSASTLTGPPPSGINLPVEVAASNGDYVSLEPILLSLPRPLSNPPRRSDFLIPTPLWPTPVLRPPVGETALRGIIRSAGAPPVAGLKVRMWLAGGPTPPLGTPYTRSDANGAFLFRFPLAKGATGDSVTVGIQLEDGAVGVSPGSVSVTLGRTQIREFQRM